MTPRENLLSLFRREGYQFAPVQFYLSPHLEKVYHEKTGSNEPYPDYFGFPMREIEFPVLPSQQQIDWRQYYREPLHPDVTFDDWGVAYEPGSDAAHHMTRMRHPLAGVQTLDELERYPFPDVTRADPAPLRDQVKAWHEKGLAVYAAMECTIWERAWYLRDMSELMMDMAMKDDKAYWLLDKITEISCYQARFFASCDVDVLRLGDDVGMEHSLMMSEDFYREFLKPRLARVIQAAREVKPDILIQYHTDGYVLPLIEDFIEVGVDILNPVQPECMDFAEVHRRFGDRLSFSGTIGTQTTMPFGKPEDVRAQVFQNLDIAGEKGGLLCCPTHILEPDVPWENVLAYVEACREYKHP